MKVLLDTSALVAYGNPLHKRHLECVTCVNTLLDAQAILCVAPQCLYEMYVILTRPLDVNGYSFSIHDAYNLVVELKQRLLFMPDPADLTDRWAELVRQFRVSGKPGHDTRLVAWMQAHNVPSIFTLNTKDFVRFVPAIQLV